MSVSVRTKKDDLPAYLKRLAERYSVTVGIHEAEGVEAKKVPEGEPATGESLVEVAQDHEFGLTVPERSFIRAPVDANEDELKSKLAASLKTALKPGGRGAEQQMARFGLYVVGQLQQNIADGIPPELSPRTLAYKESLNLAGNSKETPLILTGQLRSSIRSKVEKTK